MHSQGYRFEIPDDNPTIIKVIGVGGAGGNAVKHMFKMGVQDVNFAVCNTDRQALTSNPVPTKLQLGDGLGAGTDADEGEKAARASIEEIRHLLAPPVKMVFITAGMGGGTGTGAAPVVAEVAREMGLLTVAVVTAPYKYEGTDKKEQAMRGIEKLKKSCDTVLVVLNDKLAELHGKLRWKEAYAHADNVLANAVKSIAEIITTQGDINADFADVKKVLDKAGQSVMGSAEADGEDRALLAIEAALNSPLLNDRDIRGAKRVLLTIASSPEHDMLLDEQTLISEYIVNKIGTEARMFKFGAITDKELGKKLRVTIIAAGFETTNNLGETLSSGLPIETEEKEDEPVEDEVETEPVDNILDVEEEQPELVEVEPEPVAPAPVAVSPQSESVRWETGYTTEQTIIRPDQSNGQRLTPEVNVDTLELLDDERPDDADLIKRTIDMFVKGQYNSNDLDSPTYLRNKTQLYQTPMLPEHEFIRARLND